MNVTQLLIAKTYGLGNQKLCYIPIYKSWRKRQIMFLRMVGEYWPKACNVLQAGAFQQVQNHLSF